MRHRRRWPWILLGSIAAALLLAVLLLPRMLDVQRYRARIERALGEATGWKVELGELDFSVLRGLVLTASPVRLSAPTGGSSLVVPTVTIRAPLAPLLRGELSVKTISLLAPQLVVVRANKQEGWILPRPGRPLVGSTPVVPGEGASSAPSRFRVSVNDIRIEEGTVRFEDRTTEPPAVVALERFALQFAFATGELAGSARLADDRGDLSWKGTLADGIQVDLADVHTEALQPLIGADLVQPGGRLAGRIDLRWPGEAAGRIEGQAVRLLSGERALDDMVLEFKVRADGDAWIAENLELQSGDARLAGGGQLAPDLALQLRMPPTPLESALPFAQALLPLDLALTPPGSVEVELDAELPAGAEELRYSARGRLAAARFVAGEKLPPIEQLDTTFTLSPAGAVDVKLLGGKAAGGALTGTLHLDRLNPLGPLLFDGALEQASFAALLESFADVSARNVEGAASLRGRMTIDLSDPAFGPTSLGGGMVMEAGSLSLPGWDLEQAIRRAVVGKLGALGGIVEGIEERARERKGKDEAPENAPDGAAEQVRRIVEQMLAEVRFDGSTWKLPRFNLRSGGVTAAGKGAYDPLENKVDLTFTARCSEQLTADLLRRYPDLKHLVTGGVLSVPLAVRGALTAPTITVDVRTLLAAPLRGEEPKEKAKELLQDYLRRKLSKKKP